MKNKLVIRCCKTVVFKYIRLKIHVKCIPAENPYYNATKYNMLL